MRGTAHLIRSFRRWWLDRLILRPSRDAIDPTEQRRRWLDWNDESVEFFEHASQSRHPESPSRLVLKFPGTSGRAERSSRFPVQDDPDAAVWTWNPPGYGGSGGRAALADIADAALAFSDHVGQVFDDQIPPLWLTGNSLGCCAALHVAAERSELLPIAGLILRNPPPLIPVVMRIARRYPGGRWMQSVANALPASMNAQRSVAQVRLPIVWIQSANDRLVPPPLQDELIASHPGPQKTVVLAGKDHHEPADESQMAEIAAAVDWLRSQPVAIARHSH